MQLSTCSPGPRNCFVPGQASLEMPTPPSPMLQKTTFDGQNVGGQDEMMEQLLSKTWYHMLA